MSKNRIETLLADARALYIINNAGLLEHFEKFIESDDDPDLFSALFATVHMYSKQLGGGDLELIALEKHKFAFSIYEGNLIVLDVSVDMPKEDGLWLISQIMDRFDDINKLMKMDTGGGVVLQSLFGERGKSVTWDTLKAIKEEAIIERLEDSDIVETNNMTKINIKSKKWIKVRQIATTLVTTQSELSCLLFLVKYKDHTNFLYSGRVNVSLVEDIVQYAKEKINDPLAGAVLEPEKSKFGKYYVLLYPVVGFEGGLLVVVSEDSYTINHITTQLERVVVAYERLLNR